MLPRQHGSLHLFRLFRIDVYIHWSWFLVAAWAITNRREIYSTFAWNAWEYLALFGIVLLHEFGHSLACRQTGGQSDTIVLWPLGGVAYVRPPNRAGAHLWSLAAGPLVNMALFPLLYFAREAASSPAGYEFTPNLAHFANSIFFINLGILIFNLLPIFPLDGGQILRALLWFFIGPIRSLYVATILGFLGVAALAYLALRLQSIWIGILTFFVFAQCHAAFLQARQALKLEREHSRR